MSLRLLNLTTTLMAMVALPSIQVIPAACGAETSQWEMKSLEATPKMERAPGHEGLGVEAIYFDSEPYQGKPTKVFSYYGFPKGATREQPAPGVVCVHGGGGTAMAEWVRLWNDHGFAAIAIDTCGNTPQPSGEPNPGRRRHEWAGPPPAESDQAAVSSRDQWPYHAVAAIVRANSLLRSFPEVDADNVGVTGISWGGFLTSIAVGVDPRFKFGIPVYGCGFVHEGANWNKNVDDYGRDRWVTLWDPSLHLGRAELPMLWVNGTNDAYYLPMFQKSYRLPKGPRTLAVRVRMGHSHPAGWEPAEIYAFADAAVGRGEKLVEVGAVRHDAEQASATYAAPPAVEVSSAELNYSSDDGPWASREWKTVVAKVNPAAKQVAAALPSKTTVCYFNLTDSRGLISSSEHVELP